MVFEWYFVDECMEGVWEILVPYEQAMQIIVDSWDLVTYNLFSDRAFTELEFKKSPPTNTGLTQCWFTDQLLDI